MKHSQKHADVRTEAKIDVHRLWSSNESWPYVSAALCSGSQITCPCLLLKQSLKFFFSFFFFKKINKFKGNSVTQ